MKAKAIINLINVLGDDLIPEDEVLGFINDGLATIGKEVNATFPTLATVDDEPVIPEKWQRLLLVPFGKGRLKEKDSSQFEWEVAYNEFYANLGDFTSQYTVPDQYLDSTTGGGKGYASDVFTNPPQYFGEGW